MNTIDTIAQNAAREICDLSPVMRSYQGITKIIMAALHLSRQMNEKVELAPACGCDLTALRNMLRDEFHMADVRDMAVAQAVRDWYQAEYPHMHVLTSQPDLGAIVAKVRNTNEVAS